jgi:hypothetical protein
MPRIRTIKPDFWNDEKLGQEPESIMLTFIGMWNFSDDYGTVKANHLWLKNQIFPYKDKLRIDTFSTWLERLSELEAIIPFTHRGEGFYYIRTFRKHQRVEKPSKARNCPEDILITELNKCGYVLNESQEFVKSGNSRGVVGEDYPLYIGEGKDIGGGEKAPLLLPEGQTWNIEEDLLKNKILFDQICCAAGKKSCVGLSSLKKYHLWLVGKSGYPKTRKALYASFQLWLMNEKATPGKAEAPIKTGPSVREIEEAENRKKLGM